MEKYLNFIHSDKKLDLVIDHLNQIVDMHGFKRFHKSHTSVLIEAVNSINLMDPARSTLQEEGVSSDAFLSIDDAIKDLNELKWQECCVTSMQTLNAVDYDASLSSNVAGSALTVQSASAPGKSRRKRRLVSLADIPQNSGVAISGSLGTESCSSPIVVKWTPKKKMSVNRRIGAAIAGGGEGVADGGSAVTDRRETQALSWLPSAFQQLDSY